jgi:beta-fructofuranosidase
VGDGVDYEKYENNPVIDAKDLPEGFSRQDFRDPKLWRKSDGTYRCIVGNRPADGSGQILLFSSPDCFSWKYEKVFAANNNRFGLMWECPDFFQLDGSAVLLVSPQDMLPEGFEYHNGNGTLCLIGDYDEKTDTFTERYNQSVDYGIDFYAPQTVLTSDGRRIMIGWMQNWDTCNFRSQNVSWFGQMSLPRELHVRDGRLYQTPIRELDQLRRNRVDYQNVLVSEQIHLEGIRGRRVDMELAIRPEDGQEVYHEFILNFAQNDKYHTTLSFHTRNSILKIDRKFSGSRRAIIHQRRSLVNSNNGELKLRVILDCFSAEIFVNDGEQVMTATIYTEQEADGISFAADGAVRMDITKYELADDAGGKKD